MRHYLPLNTGKAPEWNLTGYSQLTPWSIGLTKVMKRRPIEKINVKTHFYFSDQPTGPKWPLKNLLYRESTDYGLSITGKTIGFCAASCLHVMPCLLFVNKGCFTQIWDIIRHHYTPYTPTWWAYYIICVFLYLHFDCHKKHTSLFLPNGSHVTMNKYCEQYWNQRLLG